MESLFKTTDDDIYWSDLLTFPDIAGYSGTSEWAQCQRSGSSRGLHDILVSGPPLNMITLSTNVPIVQYM